MARIVIIQPYVPAYREPFFDALSKHLAERNHVLTIVSGLPTGGSRERRDSVNLASVTHRVVPIRRLRLGPFELRLGPLRSSWSDADVVIVELAAGSISSYRALVSRTPTGVWGHVGSYVSRDSAATRALRRWQVRRAQHVLAYTEQGAATARRYGALPANVTALGNTVDTRELRVELQRARRETGEKVRQDLGAPSGPLFAMIGGLDSSKRIDLFEALLEQLWDAGSPIRFLVGGRGGEEHRLHRARDREQVVLLGHVDDRIKARMARVSLGLINPGRVGLIAVESLALGLPIITTESNFHAPEFDYLTAGQDVVVVHPSAEALRFALELLVQDPLAQAALARAAELRADEHSLERMVDQMGGAIDALLRNRPEI
jgi:glycosyltransferase involved in cell wall biosynthesis